MSANGHHAIHKDVDRATKKVKDLDSDIARCDNLIADLRRRIEGIGIDVDLIAFRRFRGKR